MELGPLNSGLAGQIARTAAGVTVGSAVLDKYAGLAGGTLAKAFSGDLFNTNVLICVASGGLTLMTHAVGGDFGVDKLMASLWLINLAQTLVDSKISADSFMSNKAATVIAVVLTVMAFME